MNEKTITLPGRDEMLSALETATGDDVYLRERFFPGLLDHAGTEKVVPVGVALMFSLAATDYESGLPSPAQRTFRLLLPRIVAALVPAADVPGVLALL